MKGVWKLVAAVVTAAGTLVGQPNGFLYEVGAWTLEQLPGMELVEVTLEAETSPVPVETVEEAWDEEIRMTQPEPSPSEIPVTETVEISLRNHTEYAVDLTDLPELPELETATEEPVVLIYHTHTSEDYGGDTEVYRAQDLDSGVTEVGDLLAQTLEARGYGVVHVETYCDYPEYNGAYSRSRQVIADALEEYPSIFLVIDLHRDAVEDSEGAQMAMTMDEDTAQVMLVVGSDEGGLEHPDWRQNLALAVALQTRLESLCPGLMRPVDLRTERFNQDLGELALLVEIGASGNTQEQANQAAVWVGNGLADIFDQYSGENP